MRSISFLCLSLSCFSFLLSNPIDLAPYENKVYSQNGEDGIIEKLFEILGTTNRYYVEFGVQDGIECNTHFLREKYGFFGLMMDCGYHNPHINLQQERITAGNINDIFEKYNVPNEFDLLSIDIDFNDFYVWQALGRRYRPRVIVIEYNAFHTPDEDCILVYNPNARWDGTHYFGASILSMYKLGRSLGYSLVYADNRGVNLFFIRDDVLEELPDTFLNINEVAKLYKPPRYGNGPRGGHPKDPYYRLFVKAQDLIK